MSPLPRRALLRGPDGESRALGPPRVERIAHTAYMMSNLAQGVEWYQRTLGVLPTDELYIGERGNVLGQFDRVDLGGKEVDHHVIFLLRGKRTGMHHVSYQMEGVDDIFFGHDYMKQRSHDHVRGDRPSRAGLPDLRLLDEPVRADARALDLPGEDEREQQVQLHPDRRGHEPRHRREAAPAVRRAGERHRRVDRLTRAAPGARERLNMIIDCHGHFTTAPKSLLEWRRRQLERASAPFGEPVGISDDELREALEGAGRSGSRTPAGWT